MQGINKVFICGCVGKEPESKTLPTGMVVANLTIATNKTSTNKQTNEKQTKTEWHRIVFFGRTAEVVTQYVTKGSKLFIEGEIQTRKYTDKEGVERSITEILASNMQMLDSKNGDPVPAAKAPSPQTYRAREDESSFDDIPF